MRPTSSMLNRLKGGRMVPAGSGRLAELAAPRTALEAHVRFKTGLEKSLASFGEKRGKNELERAIDEVIARLKVLASSVPEPGPPDHVMIRLFTPITVARKRETVPLPGLRVRALAGEKQVGESYSDPTGLAAMHITLENETELTLLVDSAAGQTVARTTTKLAPGGSPALVLEVGDQIAPHFADGRAWNESVEQAVAELEQLKRTIDPVTKRHLESVRSTIQRIDATVDALVEAAAKGTR